AELFGHLAYYFFEIQPDLPLFTHLIISALFPIYTGAHASLARPSSAAKPAKRARAPGEDVDEHEDDEDEEDADDVQRMEGLSLQDAIVMPIFAGVTLTGLYLLIKWLKDLALLNQILNAYFAFFAFGSVSRFLTDAMDFTHGVVFPRRFVSGEVLWDVNVRRRSACPKDVRTGETRNDIAAMSSPLPGFLSALPLPGAVRDALWMIRGLPKQKWTVKAYLHRIAAFRTRIGLHGILGLGLGTAAVLYFNFVDKPWFLTNLMGFAFSYIALQLMSPTTFATGSLLLSALFFYDIYMVFFTPMMVTVAKSLDIPIKLMFPRPDIPGATPDLPSIKQHAMLGLGDVVIPGIMIGLALRFDLYLFYLRKQKKQPVSDDSKTRLEIVKAPYLPVSRIWADKLWTRTSAASFPKPYFTASMVGYVFGMVVTLLVMRFMDHAQPALLYLVPGVLISLWSTALVRGELRDMWDFSEASDEEDDGDK
ncbi:peptidase A22B, signal peptide peptidase, partial [Saccharata proteae CBS 121410]